MKTCASVNSANSKPLKTPKGAKAGFLRLWLGTALVSLANYLGSKGL